MNWWANYRNVYAYNKDVYGVEKDARNFLCRCIGEAESLVLEELGVLKFLALTEQQLLEESERIAMQDRAMSVNKVANSDLQLAMGANQGVNKAANDDASQWGPDSRSCQ